ncbi:serine-rich adhesin for platelets-like [Aricia agestis]|uniref:serine-rich adhesin for platelets-like n=1 Tax=Aricia agestis TaxID=91739 RepID=UPI001C202DD1|nr:serine-rich adhesin for platelets-like [Aricia agestis]
MRTEVLGVWCALALLAAATALRTPQGSGALRIDRRTTSTISPSSSDQLEELKPTFRPRDSRSRHREQIAPRDVSRSRTRATTAKTETNEKETNTFDSRKSFSRTRSRPVINETNFDTTLKRDNTIQRTRRVNNRANASTYIPTNPVSRGINKYEANAVTEPAKLNSENNAANDQIKRRPGSRSRDNQTRSRARIDTRNDVGALDLDVAGTVNTITIVKPTTSRIDDIRNSRKLRYKTRLSETDTNLTGEGLITSIDEKSSQNKEFVTSQPETFSSSSTIPDIASKASRRKLRTSTIKSMRVVKRPVSKEKFRSSEVSSEAKTKKVSDEIGEDDNYPESFKALIQAKNASTSASSPSESLAVKASQKIYQTFTPSSQINNTSSETDDWRLRNKTKIEQSTTEVPKIENNLLEKVPENEAQLLENSSRGTTTLSPKVIVSSKATAKPSSRRSFKSSRNIKVTSTEPTIGSKQVIGLKKPNRNSIYARRNTVSNTSTEKLLPSTAESREIKKPVIAFKPKQVLPRTSYYSRSRNYTKKTTTTTEANTPTVNIAIADKKMEDTADAPIIFTYLSRSKSPELVDVDVFEPTSERTKEPFIIKVSSTESSESTTEKKIVSEDLKTLQFDNISTTTQKYHATYKDRQANNSVENNSKHTVVPPIRNIQTRKYSRKNGKLRKNEESVTLSPRSKERSLRKYSDTYSKTTESSSNGIVGEQEKPKHKFSSKYRASYLDKPFYKPTVPTITSSTVEGEEVELGSGMNAISFTKPQSPLTSADLRLSESFMKPSQILNVEASNHSPSVTVSIFDALADILTSTPKPKISSTTEVNKIANVINDVDKTLNGVSNNQNVNTINSFTSQRSITSTDIINTSAKIVQTTEGATQNVLNSLSVRENVTPSLNVVDTVSTPMSIPSFQTNTVSPITISTTPISTTSISQRKPFAFKVLYSETEPYLDKTTAVTSTTDSTAMVYNTVSDLILSNNKLVSSELTSMLSNNIESIMQNMDENRKSKLSVDMANLLNKLIPKALNRRKTLSDEDEVAFNTTPYSLEDIKDTENIDFGILNDTSITNSSKINLSVSIGTSLKQNDVNTAEVTNDSDVKITTESTEYQSDDFVLSSSSNINIEKAVVASDVEISKVTTTTVSTSDDSLNDITNKSVPVPFIPNYQSSSSESDLDNDNNNSTSSTSQSSAFELTEIENSMDSVQDPTQLSRLQLWVLSKKARVLKMIEEIIKAHHDEIDSVSLTESIKPFDDLSNRLTDIMTSSSSTTPTFDLNYELTSTRPSNPISSTISSLLSTLTTITPASSTETTTVFTSLDTASPMRSETVTNEITQTSTISSYEESNVIMKTNMDDKLESTTLSNGNFDEGEITTSGFKESNSSSGGNTTTERNVEDQDNEENTTIGKSIKNESLEETTNEFLLRSNDEETTNDEETANDFTTENSLRPQNDDDNIKSTMTTIVINGADMQTTTINSQSNVNDSDVVTNSTPIDEDSSISTTESLKENTTNFRENIAPTPDLNLENNSITKNPIPKKDYVIFGILPNNTVVRKDPNDDILESLTEASPYIIYGVLPNNTIIRKFPNGTRVPRIMQKIDILPISPWNLRNPYSPIHNIPAIVRPKSNPTRVSTNTVTFQDTSNNGTENQLTNDTVNNLQITISSSTPNIKDSSSLGITYTTFKAPTEKSTASHVLRLRTTTMLPSVDEILLNSISSATLEEMAISSMTSSTHEPRILTLDIDPETKQIRTEKPDSENGNTVFKFIPIDEVTTSSQESNVLKLASTKGLRTTENDIQTMKPVTESNTKPFQDMTNDFSTIPPTAGTPFENVEQATVEFQSPIISDDSTTKSSITDSDFISTTDSSLMTTPTTSTKSNVLLPQTTITSSIYVDSTSSVTTFMPTTDTYNVQPLTSSSNVENKVFMDDSTLLQQMLIEMGRNSKSLGGFDNSKDSRANSLQLNENAKLLQALLGNQKQPTQNTVSDYNPQDQTTLRSIEEDIKQFEEDTKLLKALLLAMGRDPAELNLPNLDGIKQKFGITEPSSATTINTWTTAQSTTTLRDTTPTTTITTTMPTTTRTFPTTTSIPTTTKNILTTTVSSSIDDDIKKLQEDTKLLQALLQFNGNQNANYLPEVTGITSNVRLSSNLLSTSVGNNPTTPLNIRPVYTGKVATTTPLSSTLSTLQPRRPNAENMGISTTLLPFNERVTTSLPISTPPRAVNQNPRSGFTTEIPSTSTFSDAEDLAFLQNLKSVLSTKNSGEDPETALANRVIALAVERSLNEIQGGKDTTSTSTTMRTTTTQTTTTPNPNTPSIEEDLKQFEEDTKLLQALLKATGQDPSKLNLPVLPNVNVSPKSPGAANGEIDLNLLSNLLASPSPLNEPFEPLTQKPISDISASKNVPPTTAKPYGAKIAVKDDLKNEQDDAKLLQTLIKLQDAQETTTQRSKLAITGQSSDEALKNLIKQAQPTSMVSEATKSSISLSTEYGNSNDALLAALLKEQGFGPTTASSLDEQLRLAALLNQVVVTPKTPRRTTTPPPPPPPPRRPILDGLAWLWQQWRETAPGPGAPRPNRGPASPPRPSATQSAATSSRVNWFGSGPFVGNAGDRPSANRIPLEPPSAAEPAVPGRGQLVSAAINVTRAFSQFLGAAIQGAAQTVQSVIRAGQRAASDVYTNGSGSG